MFEDWIDILLSGNFEFNIPELTVSSSEIGTLAGSGSVRWNSETGIRIRAMTNGRDAVMSGKSDTAWGQLIDHDKYCTFAGRTDEQWEFANIPEPRDGHNTSSNLPTVVWDLKVRSITLQRETSRHSGGNLRILIGPDLPKWIQNTNTKVENVTFGSRSSSRRDTMAFSCNIGQVSARRRSDDWFEVQLNHKQVK